MPKKLIFQQKANLFATMLADKNNILMVYNYLNNSNYTNPDEIEITTISNVIYISRKNDSSFIIDSVVNLYEHQSSHNPNMPLRGLFYFSDLYDAYVRQNKLNIYGYKRIQIPTPKYIVFYKGSHKYTQNEVLKLSDMYIRKDIEPDLEVKATIVDLNDSEEFKKCEVLYAFSLYNDKFLKYNKLMEAEKAASIAIEECINEGVLVDFFSRKKAECMSSILYELDEKWIMDVIGDDYYKDGVKDGIAQGMQVMITTLKELNFSKSETTRKLIDKFDISEDRANELVTLYY